MELGKKHDIFVLKLEFYINILLLLRLCDQDLHEKKQI